MVPDTSEVPGVCTHLSGHVKLVTVVATVESGECEPFVCLKISWWGRVKWS